MTSLLHGILNLDSFRTIIEYREELAQELTHDIEDTNKRLAEIVEREQQGEDVNIQK
jgi:hypothetical protein